MEDRKIFTDNEADLWQECLTSVVIWLSGFYSCFGLVVSFFKQITISAIEILDEDHGVVRINSFVIHFHYKSDLVFQFSM